MVSLDYSKILLLGWIASVCLFLLFPNALLIRFLFFVLNGIIFVDLFPKALIRFLTIFFNGIFFLDDGIIYLSSLMYKGFIREFRQSLIASWILFLSPLLFFSHYMLRIFFMFCMGLAVIKFVYYRWEQYTSVYAHETTTDLDILASVTEQRQKQGMAKRVPSEPGLVKRHTRQPSSLFSSSSSSASAAAAAAAIQQTSV